MICLNNNTEHFLPVKKLSKHFVSLNPLKPRRTLWMSTFMILFLQMSCQRAETTVSRINPSEQSTGLSPQSFLPR